MSTLPDDVLARLTAVLGSAPVGDGKAPTVPDSDPPKTPARYVVAYFDDGQRTAENVAHTSDLVTYRWQLTYAARGDSAVRSAVTWLREKAQAALIDVVPDVPGYQFGPIELETTRPTIPDPDVAGSPALFAVDLFVCRGALA